MLSELYKKPSAQKSTAEKQNMPTAIISHCFEFVENVAQIVTLERGEGVSGGACTNQPRLYAGKIDMKWFAKFRINICLVCVQINTDHQDNLGYIK